MDFLGWAGTRTNTKSANTNHNKTQRKRPFKKMNCSPAVKGKTSTKDTCYPDKVLMQIKKVYNENHPSQQIAATDPIQIVDELNTRLLNCEKEDCWLKELPKKEHAFLDKHIFAPDQPSDWAKNPNEWLSNFDIFNVLHQYEETYPQFKVIGPTPIDFNTRLPEKGGKCVWEELCKFSVAEQLRKKKTKIGVVFNLDKHDGPGSHWVSLFIDLEHWVMFYFDSAANTTPKEVTELVRNIKTQGKEMQHKFKYYQNYPMSHQRSNTECGMYSLYFTITMLTGETEQQKNMTMTNKVQLFKKKRIPDKYVENFRNIYFNRK